MPASCAEELWIADELWRMAHEQPRDYERFVRVVCRLISRDGAEHVARKQRRPHRASEPAPERR